MDRAIIYAGEVLRSYDFLSDLRRILISSANQMQDTLGQTIAVVSGTTATPTSPTSLSINLAAGRIYEQAAVDSSAYGTLAADAAVITQQGYAAAQTLLLSTAGLSSGQSRWALVEATFSQTDGIPSDDPTAGVLNFFNSANPQVPFIGPNNNGQPLNTVRQGLMTVNVIYGTPATTGSEVPPTPTTGYVPLYLIDLAYGQSTISSGQILTAGPSVGTGVPSNYPQAPFLAGLINSHHSGGSGQAPQIKLTSEVQGTLPLGNLPASSANSGGGLSTTYAYGGNPNGHVKGNQGVAGVSPPDECVDLTTGNIWVCTTTGTSSTAVWSLPSSASSVLVAWGGTFGGSANALTCTTSPAFGSLTAGQIVTGTIATTNTGAVTLNANSTGVQPVKKRTSSGLAALTGGELVSTDIYSFQWDGTEWQLITTTQGALAALNIGTGLQNDGAGNLRTSKTLVALTGNTSITVSDADTTKVATAAINLTLPATSTLWSGFGVHVMALGGAITLIRNGSDKIQGVSGNYIIPQGVGGYLGTDGAGNWYFFANTAALLAANNLSDLASAATALTNLGLKYYRTGNYTWSSGLEISEAHGLGAPPNYFSIEVFFQCVTAQGGYSAGDIVKYTMAGNGTNASNWNAWFNNTNVGVSFDTYTPVLVTKTGGSIFAITPADWNISAVLQYY